MDIRKVKKLIELLEESGVTEIEVCEGEESVRISRQSNVTAPQTVMQIPDTNQVAQAPAPQQAAAVEKTEPASTSVEEGHIIKAPMVGIFYLSPGPDEPTFVEIGKTVGKGDVLCIIEAMKIMNQIESDISGEIVKIHVENGEPVEYGQALFTVR